jgi:hypothetical protein
MKIAPSYNALGGLVEGPACMILTFIGAMIKWPYLDLE